MQDRPCAKGLIVYYALTLPIVLLFILSTLATLSSLFPNLTFDRVPLLIGLFGSFVPLGIIIYIHFEMRGAAYTITDTAVHARWGLLVKHNETLQLRSVRSIKVLQGPVQRLFNLGNLVLYTTSNDRLVLFDLHQPHEKKERLWQLVEQQTNFLHTNDR